MNTKLALVSLAVLGGFAALANSASANPDIRVNIGFGSPAPIVRHAPPPFAYGPPPAPVVRYAPPAVAYYPPTAPVVIDHRYDRPAGYWKEVTVKTWVPATYVMTQDRFGRPMRVVKPGHFDYRTDRVWVANCG